MESWISYRTEIEKLCPSIVHSLSAGATQSELNELEKDFSFSLPLDFKALYLLNNGQASDATGIFFGLRFLAISEIRRGLESWAAIIDDGLENLEEEWVSIPNNAIKLTYANKAWLPFSSDLTGNHIGMDFDPGPAGVEGQIINFGRDEREKVVIAADLPSFFKKIQMLLYRDDVTISANSFSLHDLHFNDALKRIDTLPETMDEKPTEDWALWAIKTGTLDLPYQYIDIDWTDSNESVQNRSLDTSRRFNKDFDLALYNQSDLLKISAAKALFPFDVMVGTVIQLYEHKEAILEIAKTRGIESAGGLFAIKNYQYEGAKTENELVVFLGNYQVSS